MSTPNPFANMPTTAAQMLAVAQQKKQQAVITSILNDESKKALGGDNVDVAAAVPNIYFNAAKRLADINPEAAQAMYQQGAAAVDKAQESAAKLNLLKAQAGNLNEEPSEYLQALKERDSASAQVLKFPEGSPTRVALQDRIDSLNERLGALNDPRGGSAGMAEVASINRARRAEGKPQMTSGEIQTYLDRKQQTGALEQAYKLYVDQGGKAPFDQWRTKFASQQASSTALGTGTSTALHDLENDAQTAVQSMRPIANAVSLLNDPRMITGTGAEARLGLARLFDTVLDRPTAASQVTDEYIANAGNLVAQVVKSFGSGTSITDSDREYAKSIAGGNVSMRDPALRTLLQHIYEAQVAKVDRYNSKLNKLGDKYDDVKDIYDPIAAPKIDFTPPPAPKKPPPGASPDEIARFYLSK